VGAATPKKRMTLTSGRRSQTRPLAAHAVSGGPSDERREDEDVDVLRSLAEAYVAFLDSFPWDKALVVAGAKEGLNKFLSNAYLHSFPKRRKYELTQLISPAARDRLRAGKPGGLVFEHLVPKRRFIQQPCEERAQQGQLDIAFVLALLDQYWVLATVTKDEDRRLSRSSMPQSWDGLDVLARYARAGVSLVANPFAAPGVPRCVVGRTRGSRTRG
jgi:hypothetical protein